MTYADPLHHSSLDDVQGLSLGVFLCGIGIFVLTSAGLITGQTAGLAVIIAYLTGYSFGTVFFLINLPFYFLAYKRLGAEFTIKSLISVTMLSVVTEFLPYGFAIQSLSPALAAVIFGALVGLGLLAMFRHNGSLGQYLRKLGVSYRLATTTLLGDAGLELKASSCTCHHQQLSDALNPLYMSVTMGNDFRKFWFGFIKF